MYKQFQAMVQGKHDYVVDVIDVEAEGYGHMMAICAIEGAIYITKTQAMEFFNLKEK